MTLEALLSRLVPALERAQVHYMLTGAVASSAHGMPRSTRDLDIVIAPTRAQLLALIEQLPDTLYYTDERQALEDVIIAKLQWARLGASDRQLQDVAGIVVTQGGSLDVAYIKHWFLELRLEKQWEAVRPGSP